MGRHTKASHGGHGGSGRLETGVRGMVGQLGCSRTHGVVTGGIKKVSPGKEGKIKIFSTSFKPEAQIHHIPFKPEA